MARQAGFEGADLAERGRDYATLNGMRGVAALAVVFYHGNALFGAVCPAGYLAVDFFFVLSGFIIAHAYERRLSEGLGIGQFALVRLIRFWPLYVAGLGIGIVREALLMATHNGFALSPMLLVSAVLAAALFLPFPLAQREGNLFPINVPSWSLFFELLVNIAYAAARPWLTTGRLAIVILVSAATLVATLPAGGIDHVGVTSASVPSGCARTLVSFGFGLLLHRARLRLPQVPVILLFALTAACFMLVANRPWFDLVFVFSIAPVLVALGAAVEPGSMMRGPARWLGIISFPIYALHRPTLAIAEGLANKAHLSGILVGGIALALLLIVSGTIALRYDEVARRWLSGHLHSRIRRDRAEAAAP